MPISDSIAEGELIKIQGDALGVAVGISAVSLPLPTGASTSALQTTGNSSLSSIDGKITTATATPSLSSSSIVVRGLPFEPQKYIAATDGFAIATSATDIFRIVGSGSKTIRIKKITISGRTTSGSPVPVIIKIIKYSTANSAGTSVTTTVVPADSSNAAGTATANHYTANPTLGTVVGNIATRSVTFQAAGLLQFLDLSFDTPIVLRGTSQQLSVNLNATSITGSSICCSAEWEEV
jgi:hypothetical protein